MQVDFGHLGGRPFRRRRCLNPASRGKEVFVSLITFGQGILDINHTEHDADQGGDRAQHRGCRSLGPQHIHRDQVLNGGGTGNHGHREGPGAQGAGHVQVPGEIKLFKKVLANGNQHKYAAVEVDAAHSENGSHNTDRQYRQQPLVFGGRLFDQGGHLERDHLGRARITHDLGKNGTQGKHQEVILHEVGESGHIGVRHRSQDIPTRENCHHQRRQRGQNIE